MKIETIANEIREFAKNYLWDAEKVVNKIDKILNKEGFRENGGEMQNVERWTRPGTGCEEEIFISYDPTESTVSVSDNQYCDKCHNAINPDAGDDVEECECKKQTTIANLKTRLKNIDRTKLTTGQCRALGGYKSMLRNIKEDGYIGGESGVQPVALKQAADFCKKHE